MKQQISAIELELDGWETWGRRRGAKALMISVMCRQVPSATTQRKPMTSARGGRKEVGKEDMLDRLAEEEASNRFGQSATASTIHSAINPCPKREPQTPIESSLEATTASQAIPRRSFEALRQPCTSPLWIIQCLKTKNWQFSIMPISAQMRTVLLNFGLLALASLLLANLGQSQRVDRRKKKSLQVEPEDQRQQLVPDGADGPTQMPFCELEMMTLDQKLALKQHVKKLIIRNRNRHHHKLFRFTRATVGEGAKIWNKLPSKSGKQFFYVVPWMLASHYDDEDFRPVLEAMDLIQSSTCIRFDHVNNMEKKQIYNGEDYLEIVNEPGCHSVIGRHSGKNLLQLELGPKIENPLTGRWTRRTCMKRRIVLHEMLHLLGLFHEHQRSDRDKFVQIDITNVQHGKRNNYVKQKNDQTWGFPFNFESIMNYRQNAFAINPKKLTIRIINGSNQCQLGMGMHEHASELDLLLVNLLYNCPGVERHIDEFIDRHFFSAGSKAHHHQHHHHQETKQMERLLGNVVKEWTQNAAWSNHHSAAVVGHNSGARHHQKQHQQKGKGGGGKQGNGKQMAAPKHHQQRQKLQHHVNRSGAGAKRNGKGSRWRRR